MFQLLREYFTQALPSSDVVRYPIAFIHLTVPPSNVDVNLEPNKTRVLLHNQVLLLSSSTSTKLLLSAAMYKLHV